MLHDPTTHPPAHEHTPGAQPASDLRPAVLAAAALTSVESQANSFHNCATRHTYTPTCKTDLVSAPRGFFIFLRLLLQGRWFLWKTVETQ